MRTPRPSTQIGEDLIAALRSERMRQGLTQRDLGARSKKSGSSVANLESGFHHPSLHTVQALADALGVTVRIYLEPNN